METTAATVSAETLASLKRDYLASEKARVVRNALTKNDIATISRRFEAEADNPMMFSLDIPTMPVTNQERSGRCWIFSSMTILREMLGKKYNIESYELSQNFIAFYDKLEKVNFFLESVLAEKDQPLDSEVMRYLLQNTVSDGGQWDMVVSIVKKYGICPKAAMPETYQSSHTASMNTILSTRLRRFAADVKALCAAGRESQLPLLKAQCLRECYGLIVSCFGMPPEKFPFEYVDKDKNYHCTPDVTPLQFYHDFLGEDLDDYVSIIHAPTEDKPYDHLYTVRYLGNVIGGNPIRFLNLRLEDFKAAILRQMQDQSPVWFGCDCSQDSDRQGGLWDDQAFDYETTFDMRLSMTKAEMLSTWHSAMNHAMVFTGVNLVDGKPTRWKIENSWGDKAGKKGYYVCSDTWFDRYVYEACVNKKYLTDAQLAVLDTEPAVLQPWDPFGSLAD